MPASPWIVMPVMAHPGYTETAIADCLAQVGEPNLLIVNQGVETEFRRRLERIAEEHPRVFLWSHQPPLPSLASTWNAALDFCWAVGAREALVVNNDVRLAPNTYELLQREVAGSEAGLVTGVGVGPKQFTPGQLALQPEGHGGPDFSCFLIERMTHESYRFDEAFIPAYCEDLDLHRRMLLDGHGGRIYGLNVPFLHYGSTTLKTVSAEKRARIEHLTATVARAHYAAKWGGAVNEERYRVPFDPTSAADDVTTPALVQQQQNIEESTWQQSPSPSSASSPVTTAAVRT